MTASLIFLLLMLGKMLDVVFPETCNSTGWFGPQCVFKCHCQNDKGLQTSCNLTSGTCYTGDRCEDGFSGTACQYTDYAFGRNTFVDTDCITNENGSVVVDGHVDTCFEARVKDGSNCSWFVNIRTPSLVTQIIVKVPSDTPDNTSWQVLVYKDNTSGEVTLQSFTDKGITLAFVLPKPMSVSRVQVLAPSTQQLRLCEVNVLGGRNTALKKNVSQGEETFNDTSGAEKAVDDERKRSYKDQCAVMKARKDDGQSLSAWWQVVLGPNVLVWSVEMHTNASLKGLDVEMELKLSNGSSMDLQYDEPRVGMALASIPRPVPATELHIRKKQKGDYLILCEVRVLGDCMDGYYGWLCDRRCSCSNTEAACDKMWGSCPSSVMGETGWSTVGYRASETCSQSGWFGPNCVYKCHCQNDNLDKTPCDFTQGTCAEGSRCEDGYTGASCQYSYLAFCRSSSLVNCEGDQDSSLAVDGKDATCITLRAMGSRDCSWSVNLTSASFVTQISVKIPPGAHDNYTWQVYCHNDRKITTTEARRQVSTDNDIIYFPPKNFLVTRVEIVVPSKSELKLCEVNIMGGRNIALKKKAIQGENFSESSGAEKAVDDEGKRYYKDQCAIAKAGTIPGQPLTSWWKVVLGQNVLAWQVEAHTCHECADVGLSMRLSNGSLVDLKYEVPRRVMIISKTEEPLQATELQVTKKEDSLTLCEVRVFGDCLDGYFGWLCEHRCNCSSPEEVCDKVWGTCRRPRCEIGWQGPRCQQACPRGFYGFQCSDKCSDNCVDGNCLHTDGSCSCKPGWEGYRCHHTCYPGSFGARCRERCSPNCAEGHCNHLDGECSKGCKPGWKGEMCQHKCEVTSGTSCTQCQGKCLDNVCHSETGECTHGCQPGWRGPHCVERK